MIFALLIACMPAPTNPTLPGSAVLVPTPPPQACTADGEDGLDRSVLSEQDFGHTWITPRMEQLEVTAWAARVAGTGPWDLTPHHLWHLGCGDGLFVDIEWGEVSDGPVTVELVGEDLRVDADGTGTFVVPIPVTITVNRVSALGCDDRFEGEVLHTTVDLELQLVDPIWSLEPETEALLSGRPVPFGWYSSDADGNRVDVGTPDSELVARDEVCLVEDQQRLWVFGTGRLEVELDGAAFASFPVVAPEEITGLTLEVVGSDGPLPMDAELALSNAANVTIGVASLVSPQGSITAGLPQTGFEAHPTGACTLRSGQNTRRFEVELAPTGPGTCTVEIEHLASGSVAAHSFVLVE